MREQGIYSSQNRFLISQKAGLQPKESCNYFEGGAHTERTTEKDMCHFPRMKKCLLRLLLE